jgi:hypothetical protein
VFHEFHVLDKASSDKVVRGRASSCSKLSFPKEGCVRKGIRLKIMLCSKTQTKNKNE